MGKDSVSAPPTTLFQPLSAALDHSRRRAESSDFSTEREIIKRWLKKHRPSSNFNEHQPSSSSSKKMMADFLHQMDLFDGLYCSEQHLDDEAEGKPDSQLVEHGMYWEEEELVSLLSKQELPETAAALGSVRREAVDWVLKVQARYGFAALTAVLAVNYLDRFLVRLRPWRNQPWMGQLAAVACLSLAAKVEETHVPLLLDIQIEGATYVFEAKTIQKMELLVLSTLQWKMNPVTPLSFVDYIARRLALKDHLCSEFLWRCENVLLSLLLDSRSLEFLPSVVAAATMLQVVDAVEPRLAAECETLLLCTSDKEKVTACCELILESESRSIRRRRLEKRKNSAAAAEAGSPRGVMECVCFSSDSSNDSWAAVSPSVSSSPEPLFKKTRPDPDFL